LARTGHRLDGEADQPGEALGRPAGTRIEHRDVPAISLRRGLVRARCERCHQASLPYRLGSNSRSTDPAGGIPIALLFLVILSTAVGVAVATLSLRWPRATPPTAESARLAGEAIRQHRGRWAARLDPEATTGLVLTLALVVAIGGGLLLAVLAYLVRGDGELLRLDESVANWGDRHSSPFATDVMNAITHLGEPTIVVMLAIVLAAVETARTRSRWVALFVLIVVAGNGIVTTTVKELADRVRPALNPVAETLGPSFPSGHASWSAAFFAAAALLLSRGRSRRVRAAIAGVAAGLAVTVAGTRVLLDVHWLSDVIAGLALGSAWFAICAIAFGGRVLRLGAGAEEAARVAEGRGAGAARSGS
jgi:membrane-associated phospholipid phosphatase